MVIFQTAFNKVQAEIQNNNKQKWESDGEKTQRKTNQKKQTILQNRINVRGMVY